MHTHTYFPVPCDIANHRDYYIISLSYLRLQASFNIFNMSEVHMKIVGSCLTLYFTDATKITLAPSNADINQGDNVTLQCHASHDPTMDLTFTWSLNAVLLDLEQPNGPYHRMDGVTALSLSVFIILPGSWKTNQDIQQKILFFTNLHLIWSDWWQCSNKSAALFTVMMWFWLLLTNCCEFKQNHVSVRLQWCLLWVERD